MDKFDIPKEGAPEFSFPDSVDVQADQDEQDEPDERKKAGGIDWELLAERRRRLPKLVQGVKNYRKTLNSVRFGDSKADVDQKIDQAVEAAERGLAEGVYDSAQMLSEKVESLERNMDFLIAGSFETEEEKSAMKKEFASLKEELEEAREKLDEVLLSDGYEYASSVRGNANMLREKAAQVRLFSEHPELIAGTLHDLRGIDLNIEPDTRIEYGPFSVSVFLPPEEFAKVDYYRAAAYHMPNSSINIIKVGFDEKFNREIVAHEDTHNLLDAVPHVEIKGEPLREVNDALNISVDQSGSAVEIELRRSAEVSRMVDRSIDKQHNELLAALEAAEGNGFLVGMELPFRLQSLATAGNEWSKLISESDRLSQDPNLGNEARLLAYRYSSILKERLRELIVGMRTSVEVAKRLDEKAGTGGSEVLDDVHALFLALRPSQYGLIWNHLRERYGAEIVGALKGGVEIFEEGQLSVGSLRGVCRLMEKDPNALTAKERSDLLGKISQLLDNLDGVVNPLALKEMGLKKAADCVRFAYDMKILADSVGAGAVADRCIDNMWQSFMRTELLMGQVTKYENIPAIVERLPDRYRSAFGNLLADSMAAVVQNDFLRKNFGVASMRDVDAFPHWKAIKDAGLEDVVRKRVQSLVDSASE